MHLVAEPHKNIGGARAALPSGRLRLALLGKLVSCHWLSLIAVFQWFGERKEGKKKKVFLPNAYSLLRPLSYMCSLCYSRFHEFHQPTPLLFLMQKELQNKTPSKKDTDIISTPPPAPLKSRQIEQKSSLHHEREVARKVKSAPCFNMNLRLKHQPFANF